MKRFNVLGKLAMVGLMLVASASHAKVVKYDFTAQGTEVSYGGGSPGDFPGTGASAFLPVGSKITGSFFYDTTLNAVFAGPGYSDYYSSTGIGVALSSNAGYHFANNVTTEYGQPSVHIYDTNPDDLVSVAASQTDNYGANHDVTLSFTGKNTAVLSETGLPQSLSLNDFSGTLAIYWTDNAGKEFNYTASIDTLTLTPAAAVPEPETYAMLLAGLALVGVARRRKQRQAA